MEKLTLDKAIEFCRTSEQSKHQNLQSTRSEGKSTIQDSSTHNLGSREADRREKVTNSSVRNARIHMVQNNVQRLVRNAKYVIIVQSHVMLGILKIFKLMRVIVMIMMFLLVL